VSAFAREHAHGCVQARECVFANWARVCELGARQQGATLQNCRAPTQVGPNSLGWVCGGSFFSIPRTQKIISHTQNSWGKISLRIPCAMYHMSEGYSAKSRVWEGSEFFGVRGIVILGVQGIGILSV